MEEAVLTKQTAGSRSGLLSDLIASSANSSKRIVPLTGSKTSWTKLTRLPVVAPRQGDIDQAELLKDIENRDFLEIIEKEVNSYYEFINPILQNEFKEFANRYGKGRSSDFLLLTLLIVTILFVPQGFIQLIFTIQDYYEPTTRDSDHNKFSKLIAIFSVVSIVGCCIVGWCIYFQERLFTLLQNYSTKVIPMNINSLEAGEGASCRSTISTRSKVPQKPSEEDGPNTPLPNLSISCKQANISISLPPQQSVSQKLLGVISINKQRILSGMNSYFMLHIQIYFVLQFLRVIFNLNCFGSKEVESNVYGNISLLEYTVVNILGNDTCYYRAENDVKIGFLGGHSMQLFILPFIFFKGLPQTPIVVIWLNYFFAVCTFFISVGINLSYRSFPSGIVWMLLTFFAIRDFQVRNMIIFLSTRNVKETMVSRNRALEESHAIEMRHLIANVAHDLKTPLASFTTGLDFIQIAIDEYEASLAAVDSIAREMVESIQTCLVDIRNTNAFMLMTINRCIDYTKVSKGIKLLPRYETIDLMETIQLPLKCMQNIQSKMKIIVLPFHGESICSHLISDKLWLQENLLCLLSNAVKYSTEGEVTIHMRLKNIVDLEDDFDDDDDLFGSDNFIQYHTHVSSPSLSPRQDSCPFSGETTTLVACPPTNTVNESHVADGYQSTTLDFNLDKEVDSFKKSNQIDSFNGILIDEGVNKDCAASPPKDHSLAAPAIVSFSHGRPNMASLVRSMSQKGVGTFNKPSTDMLVIEVEDTGIGMSNEAMKTLFNPFNQTQRLAGGTGLGLFSLAKRVEALHGKYGVRRRRDRRQGCLFWFAIPYRPDHFMAEVYHNANVGETHDHPAPVREDIIKTNEDASRGEILIAAVDATSERAAEQSNKELGLVIPQTVLPTPTEVATSTNHVAKSGLAANAIVAADQSLRILVVDDSPAILKMASMMLKKLGHTVATAENGQIAVNMVRDTLFNTQDNSISRYNIILMDLQMPVMDGLEAISRIRSIESPSPDMVTHTRHWIIGCSANSDTETQEAALSAGANIFMPKPFNVTTFCNAVAGAQLDQ